MSTILRFKEKYMPVKKYYSKANIEKQTEMQYEPFNNQLSAKTLIKKKNSTTYRDLRTG